MTHETKSEWQCYFSQVAEDATKGTESETLVAMGRNPITVQATNQIEASVAFINRLSPSGPQAVCVLGKIDATSLQSYIVCERITG